MPVGMEVGLGPGHIALDGDPKKGQSPPIFDLCLLCPNGWVDQDVTWYGGRPPPRRLCVRWGPCSPPQKRGGALPKFSAHVYCGQTAGWIKMVLGMVVGLSPGQFVLDGDPAPSSILRVEVENFEIGPEVGAVSVIANCVALEQQIILVKTRSESV